MRAGPLRPQDRAGWYKYDPQRTADPEVAELVRKWAGEEGIVQRPISNQEILDRCLWSLVNEGARILEEGYATCVSDINTIFVNGYGFPASRGGPMRYADASGSKPSTARFWVFTATLA